MLKKIITKNTLYDQAREMKKKKFTPGFDGMSMDGAASWIFINGDRLCKDILSGSYKPMPAVGFRTAKTGGGFREIARICAVDSVIQCVLNKFLISEFDGIFSDSSMAYRPGRGVHTALERYVYLANKYKYAAKIDISSCFSNIDHEILRNQLKKFSDDSELISLIMSFARMPIAVDNEIIQPEKGIIQGMPIAPLLSNIYLHSFDEFLNAQGIASIRYADDTVIFADSLQNINKYVEDAIAYLENDLNMKCNKKKLIIGSPTSIKYLGYKFSVDKKGLIAYVADDDPKTAYYNWHGEQLKNNRGNYDLLSDGILRQKDFSLLFDTEAADTSIPVIGTDVINIHSDVVFDTGFLNTALKNKIQINIFDKNGKQIGSFIPQISLRSPKTTHEQLLAYYDSEKRMSLAREFVLASIHNTLLNIRYYGKQNEKKEYSSAIKELYKIKSEIKSVKEHRDLLILEARARQVYYRCFDLFISRDDFVFGSRSKRPPKSNVNAMVSFGNTVLYSLISTEIGKTALDVRVGFLHATNSRKASLNLDFAEIFKPLLVDRVIFSLINRGAITGKEFTSCENGAVYLTDDGKRIFLEAFYNKLNTVITVGERKMSYDSIISEEIRKLIRSFRDNEKYTAFRQVR